MKIAYKLYINISYFFHKSKIFRRFGGIFRTPALAGHILEKRDEGMRRKRYAGLGLYVYIILGAALVFAVVTAIVQKLRKKKAEALYESDYGRD